ncbi:hypothetical protein A8708_05595 [Paenibacillus oryzisoli]|uniref:Uncharacterized protein n=1 Tax=Paenibacillus oryzisoli TaxID=1850517 RepID=A0A198A4T2_9BACL|nr:hypothetical protein A8708_05595 [Paenibacillus oryzisoli]
MEVSIYLTDTMVVEYRIVDIGFFKEWCVRPMFSDCYAKGNRTFLKSNLRNSSCKQVELITLIHILAVIMAI